MTPFVPRPTLTFALAVVGHRPKRLRDLEKIRQRLANVFAAMSQACLREYDGAAAFYVSNAGGDATREPFRMRLLTGFAEGADQMAAELAPPAWEVEAILVGRQADYETAYLPEHSSDGTDRREEFRLSLKRAGDRIVELPEIHVRLARGAAVATHEEIDAARQAGYARQGDFLTRQVDLIVAVWDGERPEKRGSTGDVVMTALRRGVPVLWLSASGDRDPWLLTRPEDVERETDAPDALEGPLQDLMTRILRPPAAISPKAGERPPRKRLEDFLAEQSHAFTEWTAYDNLKHGLRFWTWRRRIQLSDLELARRHWRPFLDRAPHGTDYRERLERVLLPRFQAAGQIATYYSHAYRSAYVLAYAMATLAVFVSLFGTLPFLHLELFLSVAVKLGLVAVEVGLIGYIIFIVRAGTRNDWHGRWLDARALAERLRHSRFLALMGRCDVAGEDNEISSTGPAWTSWYLRATIRELGLPFGPLDAAYQRNALLAARDYEVNEQIDFNTKNHAALTHLNHGLHFVGDASFIATLVLLIMFLVGYLIGLALSVNPKTLDLWKSCLVLFTGVLPALGAATAGMRFTGGFEDFAERSRETADWLGRLESLYDRALDRVEFELTGDALAETARIMTEDLDDWRSLYARRILTLPS